jgi:peptide deformylase
MDTQTHIALRGEKVLSMKSEAVEDPTDPLIKSLAKNMLVAMKKYDGVGISAPQLRIPKRVIIVHSRPNSRYPEAPETGPIIMINPEIISLSDALCSEWEGCLSVPGLRGLVPRPKEAAITYTTLKGERIETLLTGFPARIFQHEFDHLEGILFPLRVNECSDIYSEEEYKRRITGYL